MTSKRKYFSGASLTQAVVKAARHFGLPPEALAYEEVEKRSGFVRGRRNSIISVDPAAAAKMEEPAKEAPAAAPTVEAAGRSEEPEREAAEVVEAGDLEDDGNEEQGGAAETDAAEEREEDPRESPEGAEAEEVSDEEESADEGSEDTPRRRSRERGDHPAVFEEEEELDEPPPLVPVEQDLEDAVWDSLEPLLRLADLEIEAEIGERQGELFVELLGPDAERVVDRHGEVLEALGQLLPRLLSEVLDERVSCRIDCEGFWYRREMELARLAVREARKVLREDRSRSLAPMNPRERRIVHQAVAELDGVTTESRGDGRRKRVVIRPS